MQFSIKVRGILTFGKTLLTTQFITSQGLAITYAIGESIF